MMEFTGERYVPSVTGEIYYEHVHRYAIAAPACAGKRVLDLASGEGWGAALLARHAADVVGVDIDAAAVEHARRTYYLANLRFMTGSAAEIPLADASIDVVTSFETIEHLTDHDRMLDEFRRVLAPGGTLFISSPNKLVYSDLPNYQNPFHVRELYYQEFRDLLQRRFANVEIYGQRFVSSSVLHPLSGLRSDDAGWYAGDLSAIGDGLPTFTAPVYFVAVCSDGPLYDRVASGFVDPHDDLYGHLRHELEVLRARAPFDRALPTGTEAFPPLGAPPQFALIDRGTAGPRGAEAAIADQAVAAAESARAAEHVRADEAEALAQRRGDALTAAAAEREAAEAAAAAEREAAVAAAVAERDAAVAAERAIRAELEAELGALRERTAAAEIAARDSEANAVRLQGELEAVRANLEGELGALRERTIAAEIAVRDSEANAVRLQGELESAAAARDALAQTLATETERAAALERNAADLRAIVADREASLAGRELRLAELKRALTERSADLGRRDALIAERDAAVAEYDAMVRQRDATLADRAERITELEDLSAQQSARIAGLRTMVAERDALEARIIDLQGRLQQEHAATVAFRERAELEGAALRSIVNSRSWKLTGLLRRAANLLRGRRPG